LHYFGSGKLGISKENVNQSCRKICSESTISSQIFSELTVFFMEPNISYKITRSIRRVLADPIGTLFPGMIEENILKVKAWFANLSITHPSIVCVGDVVSNAFLSDNYLRSCLKMCIIDESTKRGKFEIESDLSKFNIVHIINPAGLISASTITSVKTHLAEKSPTILKVEGEEDLLVLPVILYSQQNTIVIYGQPPVTDLNSNIPAGLVLILVDSSMQKHARDLLDKFEKV
jgi:uncharacterized protein (UPF0218 family)